MQYLQNLVTIQAIHLSAIAFTVYRFHGSVTETRIAKKEMMSVNAMVGYHSNLKAFILA